MQFDDVHAPGRPAAPAAAARPRLVVSVSADGVPVSGASLAWALTFVLCAAFAVLYMAFAQFASGSRVATLDVQQGSSIQAPGLTLSRTGPRATRVGPVTLDPAMNPVRVVLHTSGSGRGYGRTHYTVTLRDASGRPLWGQDGVLSRNGGSGTTASTASSLRTFRVERAGDYVFDVRFGSTGSDGLTSVSLEVRREVWTIAPPILWLCGAGALVCLTGSIVTTRRRRPLDALGSRAA